MCECVNVSACVSAYMRVCECVCDCVNVIECLWLSVCVSVCA